MKAGRIATGCIFISVGVVHWTAMKFLAAIVPDYLPAHRELVIASGVAAAAGGVALIVPASRRPAAWILFAWLLAVYPANIWMAQHPERYHQIPEWMLWARLPLQLPMLWWVWRYTYPEQRALQ